MALMPGNGVQPTALTSAAAERLEVITHHLVQGAVLGPARLIDG